MYGYYKEEADSEKRGRREERDKKRGIGRGKRERTSGERIVTYPTAVRKIYIEKHKRVMIRHYHAAYIVVRWYGSRGGGEERVLEEEETGE